MATRGKRSIFQDACTLHATEALINVSAGLLPGTEVVKDSNGEFVAPTTAGGTGQNLILDYDMLQAGTVDDLWPDDTWAIARMLTGGKLACVRVATGQTITEGTKLVANGDGQFRTIDDSASPAETPRAYAEETITTTEDNTLVQVRGA